MYSIRNYFQYPMINHVEKNILKIEYINIYAFIHMYMHVYIHIHIAQSVKNLPAVQETRVQSLGWEDPLEKEMATHSSILAWKISWTEEAGGLQSMGSQRVRHD